MNEYKDFSYYFDQIMEIIDYNDWLNFTKRFVTNDKSILDLACGSGTLSLLLKIDGYDVEGLDLSHDMINVAKNKFKANHLFSEFYQEDMTSFNLNKKYDCITCYFDSLNHLPTIEMVKSTFNCVYNHLNDNGLFIFDIFSKSKYEEMNDTIISEEFDDFNYTWQMKIAKPNILIHNIKIEGYEEINETYNEYYYDYNDLIDTNKFEVINICGDFTDDLNFESERILIVLKKIK